MPSFQKLRSTLRGRLRRFLAAQAGGLVATVGITLPVIMGVGGLAVDVGLWYKSRRDYQTAADAAAVGAAWQRLKGRGDAIGDVARADSARNGLIVGGSVAMAVNNPPTAGDYTGRSDAVEVVISLPETTLLAGMVLSGGIQQRVRAVAVVDVQGQACVFALDTMASSAVKIWGSTQVEAIGCVIGSNSNASNSIDLGGSSTLKADSLWAVGDVLTGSNASVTLARPATTDAWVLDDPYAGLRIPTLNGCSATNKKVNGTETLSPGTYCGGLDFGSQAVATLNPGVYYIDKGSFPVNGQAKISCNCPNATDGVTIVLTSSGNFGEIGTVTINGGADIKLRAPTDANAPFKGVLFYQDPSASSSGVNKFNGGSEMLLTGAVYFPSQQIQFNGDNDSASNNCTQIIGRTVEFTGNSRIYNNGCAQAGIEPIKVKGIRLVE
ncbi:MAG: hypothetical protein KIT16_13465 [Rhodospirillaceae bacterium]|nr:hypothetical protein [Rhodospirillaceae bacterium]